MINLNIVKEIKPPREKHALSVYVLHQNSSGGVFEHKPEQGIGYNVLIEAYSDSEALAIAEDLGIDLSDTNEFSGDRWSSITNITEDAWERGYCMLSINSGLDYWQLPSYLIKHDRSIHELGAQEEVYSE